MPAHEEVWFQTKSRASGRPPLLTSCKRPSHKLSRGGGELLPSHRRCGPLLPEALPVWHLARFLIYFTTYDKALDLVIMAIETCPSCCDSCQHQGPSGPPAASSTDPYSLAHLLPAGSIALELAYDARLCNHIHSEDGWHPFQGHTFTKGHLARSQDQELCSQLDFLVLYRFLTVTYRIGPSARIIFLRIYIIPYDLPNVKGVLRRRSRDVAILDRAGRYMKTLLPWITQDQYTWAGTHVASSNSGEKFLDLDQVILIFHQMMQPLMFCIFVLGPLRHTERPLQWPSFSSVGPIFR